jgi:phospholipid/cholesterol/gamma-HCH transport system substrate-binding protein
MKRLKDRDPVKVGAVTLLLIALTLIAAFRAEDVPILSGGTVYTAYFSEAAGLVPDNEVRVAGVKVGKVTAMSLEKNQIKVSFKVSGTWLGDQSTASIQIKTLLGEKYVAIVPAGTNPLDPAQPIPKTRTQTPFDVTDAVSELSNTVGSIDTGQLAQSFQVIADTFKNSPQPVRQALTGLQSLATTISSRDSELARLLANTSQVSRTVADRDAQLQQLLGDGSLLLQELENRREAVAALLTGTRQMAAQLSGVVADNQAKLNPALTALNNVTTILQRNQNSLSQGIANLAPFVRVFTNSIGNGRWLDSYFCGILPPQATTGLIQANPDACTAPLTPAKGGG